MLTFPCATRFAGLRNEILVNTWHKASVPVPVTLSAFPEPVAIRHV